MSKTRFSGPLEETVPQAAYNVKVSKTAFTYADEGTVVGPEIPANGLVIAVMLNITEAFDSMTITIGDGSAVDRFMDNTAADPTNTGWKHSYDDTQSGSKGHLYSGADTVDATLTSTDTPSQGIAVLYVVWAEVA